MNMKRTGGIICLVVLLFVGMAIAPAMGSIFRAGIANNALTSYESAETEELVTIDFFDFTGETPIKKVIQLPRSEWIDLRNELKNIRTTSKSTEEAWNAQLLVLKEHDLISNDVTYESLNEKFEVKSNVVNRVKTLPIINNSIFNAMCAVNFEFVNGTTLVFGLNTFINIVGFNIISLHKGYTTEGIETKGLLTRTTVPGEYVGFMFGFLGYWLGTREKAGVYSDLIASGFTVITLWLPIPLFP
ncbi:MAG: hypothetical protein ACOC6D_05835 [Atribacterota bacterium]